MPRRPNVNVDQIPERPVQNQGFFDGGGHFDFGANFGANRPGGVDGSRFADILGDRFGGGDNFNGPRCPTGELDGKGGLGGWAGRLDFADRWVHKFEGHGDWFHG